VDAGTVLVALDVSVEESELKALEAQAALAKTTLDRVTRLINDRAAPQSELDRARAEYDVALAQIARTKAVIGRKIIRAPFRARIGLSDVHGGQYLDQGTELTTLQGVGEQVNIDFSVAQRVVDGLKVGDVVQIVTGQGAKPYGAPTKTTAIPASALRKGPAGDHVFVIAPDSTGKPRAQSRAVQMAGLIGDTVLIMNGLKPGEQVAASGSFKLREGLLVSTAEQK
jgi:membrane fusion protein (multidrug efflux system)